MPTIPKHDKTELSNTSAEIVNAVRNSASPAFQNATRAVDPADITTLRQFGETITQYQPFMNEFVNAVNRISMVLITSKMYTNPFASFKRGLLEFGETAEELFVEIAKGRIFDVERGEKEFAKRVESDVRAAFHNLNYKTVYKKTIENEELRQAFLSWEGVTDLIAKIVDSMYSGAAYDEQNMMLYMIALSLMRGEMYVLNTATDITETVTSVKALSNQMTFMSTKYNQAGVHNYTNKGDQYILINSYFDASMDVNVLAAAFNMDKVEFIGHRVLVNTFGDIDLDRVKELIGEAYVDITEDQLSALEKIPMVILDRDWFMIFDNMYKFTEWYNGEGLYWNYWYHVWKVFSHSPFANAVVVVPGESSVDSVTISPSTATLVPGASLKLTSVVEVTNMANKGVKWASNNEDVVVDTTGLVTVKIGASGTATITATSKVDPTKSGTAQITVS